MATYESRRYAIIPINADQIADGTVSNSEFQTVDTTSSINTQLGTKVALAGGTMTGNLAHGDNVKATFGNSADLEIFHDTNNSIIKNGTGTLKFLEDTTEFKNNADSSTFLTVNSSGVTGDFISGQTSTSSASGSDELLAKIGGNMRRITIANAGLAGPPGPAGATTFISDFDSTTRDLATGTQPASGTAPQFQNGTAQTGASVTLNVTNLNNVQVTYGFTFWQATGSTNQNYVTSYSTAQMALLEDGSVLTSYSPSSDEIKLIDNYFPSGNPNGGLYARRPHQVTNVKVIDVSSASGNKTFAVTMRSQFGTNVSGAYSSNNYSTTAAFSGSGTAPFPVRSYSSYISVIGGA